MRRFKINRIMEDFTVLMRMHKDIEQTFLKRNFALTQNLLIHCQEIAINAGNAIENDRSPDDKAVKMLEEYCEMIYELSEKAAIYANKVGYSENLNECKLICHRMDRCINWVREYVSKLKLDKMEVVFFPYKASMWDSLESVWMAATEDDNCDAFVVPIPYFDKDSDGIASVMHYEGNELPDYVPIVRWEDYDVAVRHPDIIFIHNPYDNTNKVTTVHMDYYAKELKKHTDMLVYIPYFVCMNDYVSEHLRIQPGTMYANKVIVQSEKVREIYIKEFHKFERENHCEGYFGIAEDKFVALGSPKYDKVLRTTRENVCIPDEWMAKMTRTNGTKKKVLLYNTSVKGLLKGKEQFLKKMQLIFKILKEREDVVLLWRPHPLSKETCEAMRPELMEKYYEIEQAYKKGNWGIYDDTSDLHRAIAISDAYYGDESSLVELYRLTGKPIMIQNIQII